MGMSATNTHLRTSHLDLPKTRERLEVTDPVAAVRAAGAERRVCELLRGTCND